MRKEPNRVNHVVLDAGVGENKPFSAQLLVQLHPLVVPESGGIALSAIPGTLLSWDCCGHPKHMQAILQI